MCMCIYIYISTSEPRWPWNAPEMNGHRRTKSLQWASICSHTSVCIHVQPSIANMQDLTCRITQQSKAKDPNCTLKTWTMCKKSVPIQ